MVLATQEFLAPTATANHVFSVAKNPDSFDLFSHRALTATEYRQHLANVLGEAQDRVTPTKTKPVTVK